MKYFFVFLFIYITIGVVSANEIEENIRAGLYKIAPSAKIDKISASPIQGIYQVVIGPDIIYMSGDGNYVLKGDLLDIKELRNLTEDVRNDSRIALLDGVKSNEYIEFVADEPKHNIYVFTDTDCGYCRKLHRDVPTLNSMGINVRYLAYPRAGVDSDTGREMASIWCAEDKNEAMNRAKNNQSVASITCDNPIAKQYSLGKKVGVKGTPAIFLEDGQALPGYMPPERIFSVLQR